jgi:hypothetical protein
MLATLVGCKISQFLLQYFGARLFDRRFKISD